MTDKPFDQSQPWGTYPRSRPKAHHALDFPVPSEAVRPHFDSLYRKLDRQHRHYQRELIWVNVQLAAVLIITTFTAIFQAGAKLQPIGVVGYIAFAVSIMILGSKAAYYGHVIRMVDAQRAELRAEEDGD